MFLPVKLSLCRPWGPEGGLVYPAPVGLQLRNRRTLGLNESQPPWAPGLAWPTLVTPGPLDEAFQALHLPRGLHLGPYPTWLAWSPRGYNF